MFVCVLVLTETRCRRTVSRLTRCSAARPRRPRWTRTLHTAHCTLHTHTHTERESTVTALTETAHADAQIDCASRRRQISHPHMQRKQLGTWDSGHPLWWVHDTACAWVFLCVCFPHARVCLGVCIFTTCLPYIAPDYSK